MSDLTVNWLILGQTFPQMFFRNVVNIKIWKFSVTFLMENVSWKCVRSQDLTVFRHIFNVKCFLKMYQKCVWSQYLIVFWHIFIANISEKCFRLWKDKCQKYVSWVTYDRIETVLYNRVCQFSETFLTSDTFLTLFQIWSDRIQTQLWIWHISDTNLTHFRHISDSFWQLTDFWQFSDIFLTDLWKWWDQH